MTSASFASLHSGLLARKGEARPVPEPTSFAGAAPAPIFQTAPLRAVEQHAAPANESDEAFDDAAEVVATPPVAVHRPQQQSGQMDSAVADMKARIRDAYTTWPAQKRGSVAPPSPVAAPQPASAYDEDWTPSRTALAPQGVNRHTVRSSVRMTHAQARALRLASIVLDRPQQELLEAGLENQLQALACSDLANCACFQAVLSMLDN